MNNQPSDSIKKETSGGAALFVLLGLVLVIGFTYYAFTSINPANMPKIASSSGQGVDTLIWLVHALMAALFIGWLGYFFYVIFRFRQVRNPKADYVGARSHASTWIEGVVAIIEGVLLIGFAIPIWAHASFDFPKEKDSTVINVIAQQFKWNGWYPGTNNAFAKQDRKFVTPDNPFGLDKNDPNFKENFFVSTDLVVPIDKPVLVYVSSLDVIHCFKINPLRVTQDAIPGMKIPAHFTPTKLGTYQINCAQLCGNSHYAMHGTMKVVSTEDYAKWIAKNSKSAGTSGGYE